MSTGLPGELTALLGAAAYPHAVGMVRVVETHLSWVFLTGELAYKLKKPVCFSFVDLRSVERRAFFCAEELRLNRRFAPELYLKVCRVTLAAGGARIEGRGKLIDYAVCMRQFRAEDELGALLANGALAPQALGAFGHELARLHEELPQPAREAPWGQPQSVQGLLLRNLEQCREASAELGTAEALQSLSAAYAARIDAALPSLAGRRAAGRVRECHGDLHAGNLARYGGRLLAFDCIEFEPAFRWIDVAEEIACLYMDLRARGYGAHAQAFIGGYLFASGDYGACRLLRLYGTHRALVRAKVAALRAAQLAPPLRAASRAEHCRYLEVAQQLLATQRVRLVLMCGLSGSGKSWLAERLAPLLEAVHLRSDIERRRLAGLGMRQHSGSALGQGLYSAPLGAATYERLRECAAEALEGGLSVIIDATCQERAQRERLSSLGAMHAASVHVVYCHAPREVLEARIAARQRAAVDASEADSSVLALQETCFEPVCAAEQLSVIDVDTTRADAVAQVLERLRQADGDARHNS
jgi:aminoglycoside phosphotransferase family enzyme/predicted kinase